MVLGPEERERQGIACLEMLCLCGEAGGLREGETYPSYLRRLLDEMIRLKAGSVRRTYQIVNRGAGNMAIEQGDL